MKTISSFHIIFQKSVYLHICIIVPYYTVHRQFPRALKTLNITALGFYKSNYLCLRSVNSQKIPGFNSLTEVCIFFKTFSNLQSSKVSTHSSTTELKSCRSRGQAELSSCQAVEWKRGSWRRTTRTSRRTRTRRTRRWRWRRAAAWSLSAQMGAAFSCALRLIFFYFLKLVQTFLLLNFCALRLIFIYFLKLVQSFLLLNFCVLR